MGHLPRYPVYVPTKDRHSLVQAITLRVLMDDGVPFRAVVEPQQEKLYSDLVGRDRILVLPHRDRGLYVTRCWIMEHAISEGHERHWQLDDNIGNFRRLWKGERVPASAGLSLWACEELTDRYSNVAISGLAYTMFVTDETRSPFYHNAHVYSCTLVNNAIPHRWRIFYNDDTDICLQVLADGWCTLLVNAFSAEKKPTMKISGGNTSFYVGDGRRKMARQLERMWPGVVTVERRYGRPQHVVDWKKFDTPLKPKPGLDLDALPPFDETGITLTVKSPIKSRKLKRLVESYSGEVADPGGNISSDGSPDETQR